MVKFAAPQHTQGPLHGYAVTGCWSKVKADPEWRGAPGYTEFTYAHHYERASDRQLGVDPAGAVAAALREWRDWREPDHIEVDAVYASQLSPSAGSQDDPFLGLEGTGSSGFERSRKTRERGRVSDG